MTVVIPEELLPPLRDGLFFDLHIQVEEASALTDPRKRRNIGGEVRACLARANRTRALLDVVGWIEPIEAPTAVEVDARKHREALLRTLLARIESEHGIEEGPGSKRGGPCGGEGAHRAAHRPHRACGGGRLVSAPDPWSEPARFYRYAARRQARAGDAPAAVRAPGSRCDPGQPATACTMGTERSLMKSNRSPRYQPAARLQPDLDLRGDKGGSDGGQTLVRHRIEIRRRQQ
jgi:hypothetical protein